MACKMEDAAKAARKKYYREWRRKNPDKVKSSNERYWIKKAAEMEAAEREGKRNAGEQNI